MEESRSKSTRVDARDRESKIDSASFQPQGEFLEILEEMSRDWMTCATAEVELGLKLSKNLIAAHSVPDAIAAYGKWLSEEIRARAEDARRLMSNGQKFLNTSSRILSNGWTSPSAST